MNTNTFLAEHVGDAFAIAAICSDCGYSYDDVKLFTYIHVKSQLNTAGLHSFTDTMETEINAIKIMLGMASFSKADTANTIDVAIGESASDFSNSMSNAIKKMDYTLEKDHGKESYIRSDLMHRLRFHTDKDFRQKKIACYVTDILPKIKTYSQSQINQAFERERSFMNLQ
jgi:hypothetical protein